ncbi:MAG: hypothetical protein H7251_01755 [Acetobacteraceae bacterium]|nr:hypothetical protein [Acetobacteraceae bacterium]
MLNRRIVIGLLASASALAVTPVSVAKDKHYHKNGGELLGQNLKKNGKHAVGKAGKETVVAEVSGGKVLGMTAGNLQVKKVMSKKKMAHNGSNGIHLAAYGDVQLAQNYEVYYGYCFYDGFDYYCYWFAAYEVYSLDGWDEYVIM